MKNIFKISLLLFLIYFLFSFDLIATKKLEKKDKLPPGVYSGHIISGPNYIGCVIGGYGCQVII